MTLKSGTSQACAACKYQRRKCTPECQLAPYFPPDKPIVFLNAHKLFGVSNILKILKTIQPSQKAEAMRSIIYQSNIRNRFPVRGCVHVIYDYIDQIKRCAHELQIVHSLIAFSQQQQQQQQHQIQSNPLDNNRLQLGIAPFHSSSSPPPPPPQTPNPAQFVHPIGASENYSFSSCCSNNAYNSAYVESNENVVANPPLWIQQPAGHNDFDAKSPENKGLIPPPTREEVIQEYHHEMGKPYIDSNIFDKQQSYGDSKKAYDSSPESSMTDTMQSMEHVADNELKTAAACFSLTSVN